MGTDRLILKGALQEKKMARMQMAARAQGLISGLKAMIQPASIVPLKDLKTGEALELLKELDALRGEYVTLTCDIEEIERDLA